MKMTTSERMNDSAWDRYFGTDKDWNKYYERAY